MPNPEDDLPGPPPNSNEPPHVSIVRTFAGGEDASTEALGTGPGLGLSPGGSGSGGSQVAVTPNIPAASGRPKDPNDIWDDDEIEAAAAEDERDDRITPDHELLFKQTVSASDVYMSSGDKDGSSAHCDALVARIKLPGDRLADISLDVTDARIVVRTPKHKLSLTLGRVIEPTAAKARWDSSTCTLSIEAPLKDR